MKQELDKQKLTIQEKGLKRISQYLGMDLKDIEEVNGETLKHIHQMAKLGMQFEREMNITKRATEMNFVRVGRIISDSKEELKRYMKRTMPQYS